MWKDTDPRKLFDIWPGKAKLWEMTCLLEADWFVIPTRLKTRYTYNAVLKLPGRARLVTTYTKNIVNLKDIPLNKYDFVITFDPILDNIKNSEIIYAYYMNEHSDPLYRYSLKRPIGNYDLFFAHIMDSEKDIISLPQSISVPYLRAPDVARAIFKVNKDEAVWVDWRTLAKLSMTERWNDACEAAAKRLEEKIGSTIRYKGDFGQSPWGITDPPRWGDAFKYLDEIARCKYYVSVGRASGAGQGLVDAASLGCICIGEQDKPYHRLVCHPDYLCTDMAEMPRKLRSIIASRDSSCDEIIAWQDTRLRDLFIDRPLSLLKQAHNLKKGYYS